MDHSNARLPNISRAIPDNKAKRIEDKKHKTAYFFEFFVFLFFLLFFVFFFFSGFFFFFWSLMSA